MMDLTFAFDPKKETPASVKRKRDLARALLQGGRAPTNIGEGLNSLGDGIVAAVMESRANKAESAGMDSANASWAPILAALGGGGEFPPAPGAMGAEMPSEVPPVAMGTADPTLGSSVDFARGEAAAGGGADAIRAGLVQRGMPEHIADAFILNFQDESGLKTDINEADPIVPGSRGGFGLSQWTGPRRRALESFATERGAPASDLDTQLDFLMTELQGPEARAAKKIFAAQDTPTAAAAIVNDFLRPSEVHRARREAKYLGGASPVQTATLDPAAGVMEAGAEQGLGADNAGLQALAQLAAREGTEAAPLPQQTALPFDPGIAPPPAIPAIEAALSGVPAAPVAGNIAPADVARVQAAAPTDGMPYAGPGSSIAPGDIPKVDANNWFRTVFGANPPVEGLPEEAASPATTRIAQTLMDTGMPEMAGNSGPITQGGGPDMQQLMGAMGNQWLSEGQQRVLGALLEQEMKKKDPSYQIGLEKSQMELEALRNPKPKPTDDITEFEYGRSNPEFMDFMERMKKAGASNTNVTVGGNNSKFVEESDKAAAGRLNEVVTAGNGAAQFLGDIQQLGDLGRLIGTGKEAELKTMLGPWAEMVGADIGDLGPAQAYESIVARLAPAMRPAGSGASSDFDARQFLKSLPSLGNSPEGNQILTATFSALQQHKLKAAEIASQAFLPPDHGGITWQEAEKQIRALPNPYQGFNEWRKSMPISEMTDEELEAIVNGKR